MVEKKESKAEKRRTQVKELPKPEQELSKEEQQKIKGGPKFIFTIPSLTEEPKQ